MPAVPAAPADACPPLEKANHWVIEDGREFAQIDGLETMAPFFLSIASASDHWFFCASNGALSAGRRTAECSLFPYLTDDRIIESWNDTGPWTGIRVGDEMWEPMRPLVTPSPQLQRRIRKSLIGDEVVFEEDNQALGLRFGYRWQLSARFGFVRRARLENTGSRPVALRIADGLDNLLPANLGTRVQSEFSCLADAYKLSELEAGNRLLVHRLAAGITDRPVPLEVLRATTVWVDGLGDGPTYLTRSDAVAYLAGRNPPQPSLGRGQRGACFLARELVLDAGQSIDWCFVADVEQTQADAETLRRALPDPQNLLRELDLDVAAGHRRLLELVAAADGVQLSADRDATAHHYQNTLCNIQRGGIPSSGYEIRSSRFIRYLEIHNRRLRERHSEWLDELPASLPRQQLIAGAANREDPDLLRLSEEYLPLILSRRHGDPSRPWNRFAIRVDPETGEPDHHFEGNWRDIFQNWEALAWSYPGYLDAFISKFLNASTIDGFNPYRITSEGVDWELLDEQDPWSSIGYWGDHQIVYLLKLIELQARVRPDALIARLDEPAYVFVDVPYRLKSWHETLADPRHTVSFDRNRHDELMRRRDQIGADGLLLRDDTGNPYRVSLAEKLLLPAAVKLANLVPDGGIWMNTQRPEWNDANNALAGCGTSVVTAAHLHRYLVHLSGLIGADPEKPLGISSSLAGFLRELAELLADDRWMQDQSLTPSDRFELVSAAGRAAERHRRKVYQSGPGEIVRLRGSTVREFLELATAALRRTLVRNRRDDGLYHSYNVLEIDTAGRMEISRLPEMLEGQVAILNSGLLDPRQSADLLDALADSRLVSDRHPSYLLYPDRSLPRFVERNRVDPADLRQIAVLRLMAERDDQRILVANPGGGFNFHPALTNSYALRTRLDELAAEPDLAEPMLRDRPLVEALYEKVFQHRAFTGRSGAMFSYEGLGSVYWHMVSKLLLAAQQAAIRAGRQGAPAPLGDRLTRAYFSIQSGLGFRQSPAGYGAFPHDPYSHSPAHGGARQPGLTGQVKEGILCRFGELGVFYENGRLGFRPRLLREAEFAGLANGGTPVSPGTIRFTVARTPVTYHRRDGDGGAEAIVRCSDGTALAMPGAILDSGLTSELIHHTGRIGGIDVFIPSAWLLR